MNLNNVGNIATPLSVYFAHLIHLFLQFWQGQFILDYSDVPYKSMLEFLRIDTFIANYFESIFFIIRVHARMNTHAHATIQYFFVKSSENHLMLFSLQSTMLINVNVFITSCHIMSE